MRFLQIILIIALIFVTSINFTDINALRIENANLKERIQEREKVEKLMNYCAAMYKNCLRANHQKELELKLLESQLMNCIKKKNNGRI